MNETSTPMITTIIPTYRRPTLLKLAIQSVLAQTYPHFRVCIYDNASGDETSQVVAELARSDDRISYFCHDENIGMFENHKFGLDRVDSKYYSFLPDDDVILPDFFETALSGFEKHPDAIISVTDVVHMSPKGNILRTALDRWAPGYYPPPSGLIAIAENGHAEFSGTLFKNNVTDSVGPWDKEVGTANDLDFAMRIAAHHPIVVSKRVGAIFNAFQRMPRPFHRSWSGNQKVIHNIASDDRLSQEVKNSVQSFLRAKLHIRLFVSGVSYVSWGSYSDASDVADILRSRVRGRVRYLALTALIYIHKNVPLVPSLFRSLVAYRRYRQEKRLMKQQHKYRHISSLPGVTSHMDRL